MWHDKKTLHREFKEEQKVLLYSSQWKLFPGKLRSRWSGPFIKTKVLPYGAVEIKKDDGKPFLVNGHQLKHFLQGHIEENERDLILQDPRRA